MRAPKSLLAVLALSSIAVIPGCGTGEASIADDAEVRAATPVPVEVAMPVREDIFATYLATSTIESDADAPVLARVPGEVVELLVEEGDQVQAGQVLARLDGERLRLEMLSARADHERASKELDRYDDLAARGLVSAAMYDGLKFDVDALRARYDLANLNYDYSKIRAAQLSAESSRPVTSSSGRVSTPIASRSGSLIRASLSLTCRFLSLSWRSFRPATMRACRSIRCLAWNSAR